MKTIWVKKYIQLSDGRLVLNPAEKRRIRGAYSYLVGFDAQVNNEIKDKEQSKQEIMFDLYKLIQNFKEVMGTKYDLILFLETIDKHNDEISEITKKFIQEKIYRDVNQSVKYFIDFRKRTKQTTAI